MDKCLNCGKELEHKDGRRKKTYCDSKCRSAHWQKTHKSKKEPKYKLVPIEEYESWLAKNKTYWLLPSGKTTMPLKVGFGNRKWTTEKPLKKKGESGIDYSIRLAQWKEQNK